MDLTPSDEQVMLRESAARFVRGNNNVGARDENELWKQFAELGWLALPLPAQHGGLGGSVADAAVILEEFGRGPLVTPYVSSVILCSRLIATLGSDKQQSAILPNVARGLERLAFAHLEPGSRGGPVALKTRATACDNGWRITGTKIAVADAKDAHTLIVSALLHDKIALFLVPCETMGISYSAYPALGGGTGATVRFDDVTVYHAARLTTGDVTMGIESATDAAITALCAEAAGMMGALLDATVSFTNARQQFGKPLTANQSVRFKLADMAVALEEARSMALRAALRLDAPVEQRVRAVAGAKASIGRRARLVAEVAIQLHGAMGVTEELTIGTYYKRILAFEAMFGGTDHQLARHAGASGRLATSGATL